jgi:hypothetical protein
MGSFLMSAINIVHISPTPLVGAPGKIAHLQRIKGHEAIAVALNDYPKDGPLEKIFLESTLLLDNFTRSCIEERIQCADIIHVHNYFPEDKLDWILGINQSATYVYQAHSPLREGPLYWQRDQGDSCLDYKLKMVVGQHWGRFYPSFIPVPNLIISPPSIRLRRPGEKLRVMFSPTHNHQGRWTNKHTLRLADVLLSLEKLDKIDVVSPKKPVSPFVLFSARRSCHVTIDEIATGGFHMVSLEGLCTGNVVINRADYFSKATYAGFCDGVMPPFQYADEASIGDLLLRLADDWELTARLQKQGYEYFVRYCDPIQLSRVFDAAYETI